jgi:nucleoside-diphosphate-sugar epimerase
MASKRFMVTGAFSYSGRYITRRLLDQGHQVSTLTGHPDRPNPFGDQVKALPFNFDHPDELADSLKGADALINTYWVRYDYGGTTYRQAVANTKTLFDAAKRAGVKRVVHVSIANPSLDSKLPYYHGKAELEQHLIQSSLSYAILRPTVLFGGATAAEDVLINNIAWLLRRLPVFGLPGDGSYGIQPIHVDDQAALAVRLAGEKENTIVDAVGPETFTFRELVELVKKAVGSRALILPFPPSLALLAARAISPFLGDVMLTREEVIGLMDNLLVSSQPPTGTTKLSEWLAQNAHLMGARYSSEVGRHFK